MIKKSWNNLISEGQFWEIIDGSLIGANYSIVNQEDNLRSILAEKTTEELVGFWYHDSELYRSAYQEKVWAALFIVTNGFSTDDTFHYFRCWLVSRGKKIFYDTLSNPDSLYDELDNFQFLEDLQIDALGLIANEVYKNRVDSGPDLLDIMDEEYRQEFENKDEAEMSYMRIKSWNLDDMDKLCPNLDEKYWGKPMPSRYG